MLKELLTALIPGSKRVYKKSKSVESKSTSLSASKVGGHGETFQIVKENITFFFSKLNFARKKHLTFFFTCFNR